MLEPIDLRRAIAGIAKQNGGEGPATGGDALSPNPHTLNFTAGRGALAAYT